MKKIRQGLFETNSSSTHSITIVDRDIYNQWRNGELLFDSDNEDFIPNNQDEKIAFADDCEDCTANHCGDCARADCSQTYAEYFDDTGLETFVETYTTKNGDEVVAFGRYGYD